MKHDDQRAEYFTSDDYAAAEPRAPTSRIATILFVDVFLFISGARVRPKLRSDRSQRLIYWIKMISIKPRAHGPAVLSWRS